MQGFSLATAQFLVSFGAGYPYQGMGFHRVWVASSEGDYHREDVQTAVAECILLLKEMRVIVVDQYQ